MTQIQLKEKEEQERQHKEEEASSMLIQDLKDILDRHDCNLSPDSGCPCEIWREEINQLVENQ